MNNTPYVKTFFQLSPFLFVMKHYLLLSLAILAMGLSDDRTARALDQSESLALLVDAVDDTEDPDVCRALLRGMLKGLSGQRNVSQPKGWDELRERFGASEDSELRNLVSSLSQIFGDPEAIKRALTVVADDNAQPKARRAALRSLLAQQNESASDLLESLLDDEDLGIDAIRGYAAVENAVAPGVLLSRYEGWQAEKRRAVIETLATRKRYAQALLAALREEQVSRDAIPAHVARSLKLILGDSFTETFGEVRGLAADREQAMKKYKTLCSEPALAKADASRGRAIFVKTCASCHLLYGEGAKIGPDLTGSNRANLDYILLNSVDPSYDVPDGYKMVAIQTVDGRVLSGVVAEEDAQRVVLKTVEQPSVVIAKEDIEARKVSDKSMMPDGQLDQLKPQQVLDLIKYLRTTAQVELPR